MKHISHSLAETAEIAHKFILEKIKPQTDRALIVALQGDLGSGKTSFTQAVCRELGVKENVTSPTFVLEKIYKITHPDFDRLVHIDAYRLSNGGELTTLGWSELIGDKRTVVFLEWPELVADVLTGTEQKINFKFLTENEREIDF
jgi:tRNA threonylcarbamoyladenosine biosynthesis protein TsaE